MIGQCRKRRRTNLSRIYFFGKLPAEHVSIDTMPQHAILAKAHSLGDEPSGQCDPDPFDRRSAMSGAAWTSNPLPTLRRPLGRSGLVGPVFAHHLVEDQAQPALCQAEPQIGGGNPPFE